ncbi:hypothetical protein [Paludibacterium sp.]|uniref:hypothetical protein n=1 Tax=Paludibacterium sp. TaxID=1917523 RepID=UPI0025CF0213|nr:hypothetical protein [Paludibacterium sp.]MBV8649618.1 hypothetical protein [Paludibacterium sp.]
MQNLFEQPMTERLTIDAIKKDRWAAAYMAIDKETPLDVLMQCALTCDALRDEMIDAAKATPVNHVARGENLAIVYLLSKRRDEVGRAVIANTDVYLEKNKIVPWYARQGGYSVLDPVLQIDVMVDYEEWAHKNPEAAKKHGVESYCAYRQQRFAENQARRCAAPKQQTQGVEP